MPTDRQPLARLAPIGRSRAAVRRAAVRHTARRLAVAVVALAAWTLATAATFEIADGSEANYRVREQLAGVSFPNDAVGVTRGVSGSIAFDDAGAVVEGSAVVVDLAGLVSDQSRRDGFVRNNTLQTARFPTATFVPTAVGGLTFPLPDGGEAEVEITGELTVRGVTRPVTWIGVATFDGDEVRLEAATTFTFEDFDLVKPRVASVLSVADQITLEIRLRLVQPAD